MSNDTPNFAQPSEDEAALQRAYRERPDRTLSAFSNFAISLSIICILAGGLTSFQVGLCSVGGASIGLGWPLMCLLSLAVAATMAQVASAFPTAGGPYHWASLLGGRGWGWLTACFNLAGLVTVLAAINVGTWLFAVGAFGLSEYNNPTIQACGLVLMTMTQAFLNHWGTRLTGRLIDLSGYLILVVAAFLTLAMIGFGWRHGVDFGRLVTFTNYSGLPPGDGEVWPRTENLTWLFFLGLLLPAYTLTGFDASGHISEETVSAALNAPRGIVRSVWVSGLAGWVMLIALVLAIPDLDQAAAAGGDSIHLLIHAVIPGWLQVPLYASILAAQYLCGLAALTSTSRMTFAFARDGGLPLSRWLGHLSATHHSPAAAVWSVGALAAFSAAAIKYEAIAAICAVFLYISYVLPTALGLWAYGRGWTRMGPWHLGRWFRPLAAVSLLGCGLLIVIGVQPPNQIALPILGCGLATLAVLWFGYTRRHFSGPPAVLQELARRKA